MSGACEGLRVIDFSTTFPGALASMVLADCGAEVIKVEPPGGEPTREHYASIMWHRGKKSLTLDLKSPEGVSAAQGLCAGADVVLQTFRPGVAERLGVDYPQLAEANPGLVFCTITGFGTAGPYASYKAYEGIVFAKSGRLASYAGQIPKDGPIYASGPVASYTSAMLAIQGIMAALLVREQTGRGQRVETTLLQALVLHDAHGYLQLQLHEKGRDDLAMGAPRMGDNVRYLVCRTKDGRWLQTANQSQSLWENWLEALGLGHLLEDSDYLFIHSASEEVKESLRTMLLEKIQEKTLDEWMTLFSNKYDVVCEPLRTTQEGMEHPQIVHNGNVIEVEDPQRGLTRQLGPLAAFSETPAPPRGPAPEPGQHNALLPELLRNGAAPATNGAEPMPPYPLAGKVVLEIAEWMATPIGVTLLAELGARVIKVERLEGDLFRILIPIISLKTTQGKESLAIDLRQPEGQEVLHRLVAKADVLINGMRPGVAERLGFTYETCRKINPRLVYGYSIGYGSTGPSAQRGVFHPIGGAVVGGALYQAGRGMPPPPDTPMDMEAVGRYARILGNANEGQPDVNTGAALVSGVLLALYAREKTGKGQYLEVTMLGANAYANADDFIAYPGKPERLLADPQLNGLHALYRLYPCRQGWVFLACPKEQEWRDLCSMIGLEHLLSDPRFSTHQERLRHDEELAAAIGEALAQREAQEWEDLLMPKDVPCVEVYPDRFGDFMYTGPYRGSSGASVPVPSKLIGDYQRYQSVYRFSATTCVAGKAPEVGEHTRGILEELGYGEEAARDLLGRSIVAVPD